MALGETIIAAAAGLVGVAVGAWLTDRSEQRRMKLAFSERRLTEFYAPMLGLRKGIKANSDLRVLIQSASEQGWQDVVASVGNERFRAEGSAQYFEPYRRSIEFDNEQFREEILPDYEKMIELFRERISLAYPDTAQHFDKLVEFVSIWKRHLDESLPVEALKRLNHTEENLHPFYQNLQERHDQLVKQIANGKPD